MWAVTAVGMWTIIAITTAVSARNVEHKNGGIVAVLNDIGEISNVKMHRTGENINSVATQSQTEDGSRYTYVTNENYFVGEKSAKRDRSDRDSLKNNEGSGDDVNMPEYEYYSMNNGRKLSRKSRTWFNGCPTGRVRVGSICVEVD